MIVDFLFNFALESRNEQTELNIEFHAIFCHAEIALKPLPRNIGRRVIATLLCAAAMVAIEVLAYAVDTLHLRGLKQALETGIPYSTPPARYPLIRVKNFCVMFSMVPSLCLILVLLGYLW